MNPNLALRILRTAIDSIRHCRTYREAMATFSQQLVESGAVEWCIIATCDERHYSVVAKYGIELQSNSLTKGVDGESIVELHCPSKTYRLQQGAYTLVLILPTVSEPWVPALAELLSVIAHQHEQRTHLEFEHTYQQQLLETLLELTSDIALVNSYERILQLAALRLMGHLLVNRIFIVWSDGVRIHSYWRGVHPNDEMIRVILSDQFANSDWTHQLTARCREYLNAIQIAQIIPLRGRNNQCGFIAIGRRSNDMWRTSDDQFAHAYARMLSSMLDYTSMLEQVLQKQQLERELELARSVQLRLLPSPEKLQCNPNIAIAASVRPSHHVSGDYFDIYHRDQTLVVIVADVCGKGVGAALIMAHLHAAFHLLAERGVSPSELLEQWNRLLARHTSSDSFVSAIALELDIRAGIVNYSNAGHPHPLIVHSNGTIEELAESSLLLGINDYQNYSLAQAYLPRDAILCLVSDGVIEAHHNDSRKGVEFLKRVLVESWFKPLEDILRTIFEQIDSQYDAQTLHDDQTIVLLRLQSQ